MNKIILIGRLTRDPEIRYSTNDNNTAIARYTLAVNRPFRKNGEQQADFLPCIAFGKTAEFAEKYLAKGMRVAVEGRIQTGSYTNQEGQKIYTTDVVVERQEFPLTLAPGEEALPALATAGALLLLGVPWEELSG